MHNHQVVHTEISAAHLVFWIAITTIQWAFGIPLRDRRFSALRWFLLAEAGLGTLLIALAKILPAWPYFYCWVAGNVAHEAIGFFLMFMLLNSIRRRALPSRNSMLPLQFAIGVSFATGICLSAPALQALEHMPIWRMILSWDYAAWCSMCILLLITPMYATLVVATPPRHVALILAGFGFYAASNTGMLEIVIQRHTAHGYAYLSDVFYCISLVFWLLAARLKTTTIALDTPEPLLLNPQVIDTEHEI